MAKQETQNQESTAELEQPTQQAPGLTLQDLVLVAQIIQLTSQRGAFKAEELQNVGTLYNKLVVFLESTGAVTRAPANTATEEKTDA